MSETTTSRPLHDLNAFQRDLLYQIEKLDKPNGSEIMETLQEVYDVQIHHGRLYPNLDTLVDKGLVNKGSINQRSNFYVLTNRGRRELNADRNWRRQ